MYRFKFLLATFFLFSSLVLLQYVLPDTSTFKLPSNIFTPAPACAQLTCGAGQICTGGSNQACPGGYTWTGAVCGVIGNEGRCCAPNPPPVCSFSGCGPCNIYNANTCNNGNVSQLCTVGSPPGCTGGYQYYQVCGTINACFANYRCVGGVCRPLYSISGAVRDPLDGGNGVPNITVRFAGKTTTTGAQGNYSFGDVALAGNYNPSIVVPAGWKGIITSVPVTVGPSQNGVGFRITKLFSIQGNVRDPKDTTGGNGVPGVTVHFNGQTQTTDNAGHYAFGEIAERGSYDPTADLLPCYNATAAELHDPITITNANLNGVGFTMTKEFTVSGRVTDPYNGNSGIPGVDISTNASGGTTVTTNAPNGGYTFPCAADIERGTHTFTQTLKAGFTNISALSQTIDVQANTNGIVFNQTQLFSLTGNVFIDPNVNGSKDAGESNYLPASTFSYRLTNKQPAFSTFLPSEGTPFTNTGGFYFSTPFSIAGGNYTVDDLISGPVRFSYTSLPAGYYMTSPINGPPPTFNVTIGYNCNVTNGGPDAGCGGGGNIHTLNFGIINDVKWLQTDCGDIRIDNGITNPEPNGEVAIITDPTVCSTAPQGAVSGVVFSGNSDPVFNPGNASATGNVVGDATYPETFSSTISSSYDYLLAKAQSANLTLKNLPAGCFSAGGCALNGLTHGIYVANGNVTLHGALPPPNTNIIFLIKGNLTITGPITVPVGDTVIFAVSGDITVNNNIGWNPTTTTVAAAPTDLQGIYTADGSFIINSKGVGNCPDLGLKVGGTIIANATLGGGNLQNNRNLCQYNALYPSLQVTPRLDFFFNLPEFLRTEQTVSQEVNP